MAWDDQHKKVAIKVIGTVESNLDYGAINYSDPITVGIAQWFGTRAANLLSTMKSTAVWNAQMQGTSLSVELGRHGPSDSFWNTYYLSRSSDVRLRTVLKDSAALQDQQLIADFKEYENVAKQYGIDVDGNTDAFILWACAYHQSPRAACQVAVRFGNVGLRDMYNAILAHGTLGQYKTRYEKAYAIISSGDVSGVGSGVGSSGATVGNGGTVTTNGTQQITIDGGELVVSVDNTNVLFAQTKWGNVNLYPCGVNSWKANLNDIKTLVNVAVEQQAAQAQQGGNAGGVSPGDGSNGAKALAWMKSRIMKFAYRQAPGRLDPDKSGFGDCSSTIYRAYMDTCGINPGTWTGDMYFRGSAVIERGSGAMSAAQKALCRPGDVIVMSWGGGYPHTDHVEMFVDSTHTIGHGGDGPGPHINSIGMLSGARWWTVRRH